MNHLKSLIIIILFVLLLPTPCFTEVTPLFMYNGSLSRPNESPYPSGIYEINFYICTDDACTNTPLWSETHSVEISAKNKKDIDGGTSYEAAFSVILGVNSSLDHLAFDQDYYLRVEEITLGHDNTEPIAPVPYSVYANFAGFANVADFANSADNAEKLGGSDASDYVKVDCVATLQQSITALETQTAALETQTTTLEAQTATLETQTEIIAPLEALVKASIHEPTTPFPRPPDAPIPSGLQFTCSYEDEYGNAQTIEVDDCEFCDYVVDKPFDTVVECIAN
ncbi:MAG: hypothetical protein ACMUJM_20055 [bacterium]